MSMTPEEKADRICEASDRRWCRCVTDIMSSQYMVYHWSMPVLLAVEAAVLLFLAVWPLWGGVIAFIVAVNLFSGLNELVAYLAWRRYDRLRSEKYNHLHSKKEA
jgi:hypothetical protein